MQKLATTIQPKYKYIGISLVIVTKFFMKLNLKSARYYCSKHIVALSQTNLSATAVYVFLNKHWTFSLIRNSKR